MRQRGSHRQYRRRDNPYVVTVAGKANDALAEGTWSKIQPGRWSTLVEVDVPRSALAPDLARVEAR